jgi:hypothetical protein
MRDGKSSLLGSPILVVKDRTHNLVYPYEFSYGRSCSYLFLDECVPSQEASESSLEPPRFAL